MSLIIPGRKLVKQQQPLPSSPIQWKKNRGQQVRCLLCNGTAGTMVKVMGGYKHQRVEDCVRTRGIQARRRV